MKVCIHALRLGDLAGGRLGGNFSHVFRLVTALEKCQCIDLYVLADEASVDEFRRVLPPERVLCYSGSRGDLLQAEVASYRASEYLRPDIFHRPIGQLPMVPLRGRLVMGVADLNFRDVGASVGKRLYKETSYRISIHRADAIVCISEFTKQRLAECFPSSEGRASVIHHGSEGLQSVAVPVSRLLEERFWLCFGHRRNKNLETSVAAFHAYLADHRDSFSREKLVIIGSNDYSRSVLAAATMPSGLSDSVLLLEYVSEGELVWLYKNASGLLFPSTYEGFGLPIVEAMSCGCPVIASSIPSLLEVGGDAALYSDSGDFAAMSKFMAELAQGTEIRAHIVARGYQRLRHFSWNRAAVETLTLYRRLNCSPPAKAGKGV